MGQGVLPPLEWFGTRHIENAPYQTLHERRWKSIRFLEKNMRHAERKRPRHESHEHPAPTDRLRRGLRRADAARTAQQETGPSRHGPSERVQRSIRRLMRCIESSMRGKAHLGRVGHRGLQRQPGGTVQWVASRERIVNQLDSSRCRVLDPGTTQKALCAKVLREVQRLLGGRSWVRAPAPSVSQVIEASSVRRFDGFDRAAECGDFHPRASVRRHCPVGCDSGTSRLWVGCETGNGIVGPLAGRRGTPSSNELRQRQMNTLVLGLELDLPGRKVYRAARDLNQGSRIRRADVDGAIPETVVPPPPTWPWIHRPASSTSRPGAQDFSA